MDRLKQLVAEKAEATEEKTYTVIPELRFTDKMLNDTEPLPAMTYKQMFDLFVASGEVMQADDTLITGE